MFNICADYVYPEIIRVSKKIGRPKQASYYYSLPEGESAKVEKILCFSHAFKNVLSIRFSFTTMQALKMKKDNGSLSLLKVMIKRNWRF
jgi:hypothetical protein